MRFEGEFDLMPFTCIVDPERLRMIMPEAAQISLPSEMRFLLDAQMAEADIIVLNKIDLLTKEELEKREANARAAADSQVMADIVEDTLEEVKEKYNLKSRTNKRKHRSCLSI